MPRQQKSQLVTHLFKTGDVKCVFVGESFQQYRLIVCAVLGEDVKPDYIPTLVDVMKFPLDLPDSRVVPLTMWPTTEGDEAATADLCSA